MNIYRYQTIADYLNDHFQAKKAENPLFSLQVWCRKLGISSTSALSHILSGKRPIPAKFVPRFIEDLGLNENESRYFMELFFHEKTTQSSLTQKFLQRLNPFNWKKKTIVTDRSFLLSPLSFALVVLKQRGIIKNLKFENLRTTFHSDISDYEIQNLIDHFELDENLDFERLTNAVDIEDQDVQRAHEYYLQLASKRVFTSPITEKEYNSYSINIKKEDIPNMQKEIRYFLDSLIQKYDNDNDCDSTYQMGTYLFELTRERK